MYGYAEAPHQTIDVTRLGAPEDADSATDVLVIWMATQPRGGRRIVGWYDHATVFRKPRDSPPGANRLLPSDSQGGYVVSAPWEDCVLLSENKRTCQLPPQGPGAPSQSNVWYADNDSVAPFRERAVRYVRQRSQIAKHERRKYGPGGEGPDHRALKKWCARNPQALGLNDVISSATQQEYEFQKTGDRADVVFELTGGRYVVLEVKTIDVEPGAYQALKYRVLMCAEKRLPITSEKVEGLLVAWQVPTHVRQFCDEYHLRSREVPREVVHSSQ